MLPCDRGRAGKVVGAACHGAAGAVGGPDPGDRARREGRCAPKDRCGSRGLGLGLGLLGRGVISFTGADAAQSIAQAASSGSPRSERFENALSSRGGGKIRPLLSYTCSACCGRVQRACEARRGETAVAVGQESQLAREGTGEGPRQRSRASFSNRRCCGSVLLHRLGGPLSTCGQLQPEPRSSQIPPTRPSARPCAAPRVSFTGRPGLSAPCGSRRHHPHLREGAADKLEQQPRPRRRPVGGLQPGAHPLQQRLAMAAAATPQLLSPARQERRNRSTREAAPGAL
mmetsp:Transcript_7492/g.17963  ORF Transcript_7492/g.17963 Transcript_7492/m.17963 type:complete len:286 (-) Transcript_7492:1539-2396(-)